MNGPKGIKGLMHRKDLSGHRLVSKAGVIRADVKRFIEASVLENLTIREAYARVYGPDPSNEPYLFNYRLRKEPVILAYIEELHKVVRAKSEYTLDAIEDMRAMLDKLKEAGDYAEYTRLMKVYTSTLNAHAITVKAKEGEGKDVSDIQL